MDFVRALEDVLKYRKIPPTLEILYEEREGRALRSVLLVGSGKVKFHHIQPNGSNLQTAALTTPAEIEKILSYLFVHEFWKVKSMRGKDKQITLSVRVGPYYQIVSLPHEEIRKELENQVDKGKMLERPAGRFLVATMWIEGLINKLEKKQKQNES